MVPQRKSNKNNGIYELLWYCFIGMVSAYLINRKMIKALQRKCEV